MDDFHRYMDVLHVLRTPKLGDGLSPERVEKLLVDSLPPVDTAPIDQAAELFRKMDTIEAEIRRLQKQRDQAEDIELVQVEAVEAEARLRADLYLKALDVLRQKEKSRTARAVTLGNAREFDAAEREFVRAIELGPTNARAHYWYSVLLVALQPVGDLGHVPQSTPCSKQRC